MAKQRKRSVHGGGSVFLRQDGRYEAKFKVEETGKYKSLYASTEKEAYRLLEEAKFQQRQGTLATGPQQTVKQFLEYWLEDVEKPAVRLRTYVNNRVVVYKHLIPGIGHFKLRKLTAHQLQLFYAKKLREGTSASRIVRLNAVLHKALDHAKRISLVGMNVADRLDLPKPERHEAHFLTPEQARSLLREATKKDLDALIALALITGMRKGEILALRWSDINLNKGTLQVVRTVSYYGHYHFMEGKPKTKSSERSIGLPRVVVTMLVRHHEAQQERRSQVGEKWVDNNLVFCNRKGGFIMDGTLTYQLNRLLEVAGLPRIRFHDLRHSAATILLGMKVPAHVVQKLLGHNDITTTLGTYGHVLSSMQDDMIDGMNDFYEE